jgi:DNA phosphorothioation-associated putative methyltransferase
MAISENPGQVGKRLGTRIYVHTSAAGELSGELTEMIESARRQSTLSEDDYNVVRYDALQKAISFLAYPDFFTSAFPALSKSWLVRIPNGRVSYRTYEESLNPPILHRKELLLPTADPRRQQFENLTTEIEALGLFSDPVRIGFKLQWERLLQERGFKIVGHEVVPIGNDEQDSPLEAEELPTGVARHLTALSRQDLSAPMQLLDRYSFLDGSYTVFDYGCGKGDDLRALKEAGILAAGWDPHYAPSEARQPADIVNLGFVINVIEDPVERREALHRSYELAQRILAVSTMIATEEAVRGTPYGDGILTARNTFQKYFTQAELRHYLQSALDLTPISVAPGIFFVFKDKEFEQRFLSDRYRSPLRARTLLGLPRPEAPLARIQTTRQPSKPSRYDVHRPLLETLSQLVLELGREPKEVEVSNLAEIRSAFRSLGTALRWVLSHADLKALEQRQQQRRDDILVFLALQQFQRIPRYKSLEPRLQADVRAFFGSYGVAQEEARQLLFQIAQPAVLDRACQAAAERGLGWLNPGHSLELYTSLLARLPAVLRAYVGCAALLYGDAARAEVVKVHIASGKVSFMRFEGFESSPLPKLKERVKVNLRTQSVEILEYGDAFEPTYLYLKSRFINEEIPLYAEQQAFDKQLQNLGLFDFSGFGPSIGPFGQRLHAAHLKVVGFQILPDRRLPDLDEPCGQCLTYRQLIECGNTWARLRTPNLPKAPETYRALFELATKILDPVIEYYGSIELSYGFCSAALAKKIKHRIAPTLDQHAACEITRTGKPICPRGGAAVDFFVRDENMREVAEWIVANLPFDRLYFYGEDRPMHVSYGPEQKREAIEMAPSSRGTRIPRPFRAAARR